MGLVLLAVANIPVFLFIGWLAFDTAGNAADTFIETLLALLKQLFVPPLLRVMLGMDTSGAIGIVPMLGFFFACGAMVVGEAYLLDQWFGTQLLPAN